jgi:hypothetical protein
VRRARGAVEGGALEAVEIVARVHPTDVDDRADHAEAKPQHGVREEVGGLQSIKKHPATGA